MTSTVLARPRAVSTECTVPGCVRPMYRQKDGVCHPHAKQKNRTGSFSLLRARDGDPVSWLLDTFEFEDIDRCILWPFGTSHEYGSLRYGTRTVAPHILVAEWKLGPRPVAHAARQRCGNKLCVSQRHVLWVPVAEINYVSASRRVK